MSVKSAPDVTGRTRNGDNGLPHKSRFAVEQKIDGDPLAAAGLDVPQPVDNTTRFAIDQRVSVRVPGLGLMKDGIIGEAYDADDEFPNGGLFGVAFPNGLSVEAFWAEIEAYEPEPDIQTYSTGGGLLMEPIVYHVERDGELIIAVETGDNEFRVTGDHGSAVFRTDGPYISEIYEAAARAYDEVALETLEAESAALTAALEAKAAAIDVYRQRLAV